MIVRGILLVGLLASSVSAQETREPPPEAIQLFDEARAHYEAGQYPDAAEDLELALTLDPGSSTLLFNLARVYELLGDLDRAVNYGQQYLQLVSVDDEQERANAENMLRRLEGARDWLALRAQAQQNEAPQLRQLAPRVIIRDRGVADMPFWVTLGAGAAVLVAGAALGGVALSAGNDVNSRRVRAGDDLTQYQSNLESDADRADTMALTADVLMGVGGAAVVSALLLYVLRVRTYERDVDADVAVGSDGHGATIQVRGSF